MKSRDARWTLMVVTIINVACAFGLSLLFGKLGWFGLIPGYFCADAAMSMWNDAHEIADREFPPSKTDTIYGHKAIRARFEMLAIRRQSLKLLSAMRACQLSDPDQYKVLSDDYDKELEKFTQLEQKYFG